MKITINGLDYYISWHYKQFLGKQMSRAQYTGIVATCFLRKKVEKPEEGQKAENPVVLQKSITVKIAENVTKQGLRNMTICKVIDAWDILTKEQKKYIWDTYIKSQNGSISTKKPKLKYITKIIANLSPEQREEIGKRFFSDPAKVIKMKVSQPSDESIHHHA